MKKTGAPFSAKHLSKSRCTKPSNVGPLLKAAMPKKPLRRNARLEVKMHKPQVRSAFGSSRRNSAHFCGAHLKGNSVKPGRMELRILSEAGKAWGFAAVLKAMAGALEEDLERCTSRGRRSTRDRFIRTARRSGFPEKACSIRASVWGGWLGVIGAALRTIRHQCPGAALYTDGVEKSQNALAWDCQLSPHFQTISFVPNWQEWGSLSSLAFWPRISSGRRRKVSELHFVMQIITGILRG